MDDKPYGGGPGMLMQVQPLRDAIHVAKEAAPQGTKVVCLSPQGKQLDHSLVTKFHSWGSMILVAGRYEGIDVSFRLKSIWRFQSVTTSCQGVNFLPCVSSMQFPEWCLVF